MAKAKIKSSIKRENDGEKYYDIKIPVYTTELIEDAGTTYSKMIDSLILKLADTSTLLESEGVGKRNKTQRRKINGIEPFKIEKDDEVPMLLLKTSASLTNFYDGFILDEQGKKERLKTKNGVGSDTNFMLFYPYIQGIVKENFRSQWIILIYEDPNKEHKDIIETSKIVLNFLNLNVKNIKPKAIIEELSSKSVVEDFEIRINTTVFDENDPFTNLEEYLISTQFRKDELYKYKNVPSNMVVEIIRDFNLKALDGLLKGKFKKILKIITGKKEFNITQEYDEELNDNQRIIKEAADELYNATSRVYESDLTQNIYDQTFVVNKLKAVLTNYISTVKQ